jgi:hypothetical protein
LHNVNSPTNNQQNVVTLQRKVSDRKSKRVRAKQNDVTGLASSTEILRKSKEKTKFYFLKKIFLILFKMDLMMKY